MNEDKKLRDLLLRATKDPALRMQFLSNPEAVAKQYDVMLKPEYLEKIKKAASFIESLNDIRLPIGPIFYPLDAVLNSWTQTEMMAVIRYPAYRHPWISYPLGINRLNPQPLPP